MIASAALVTACGSGQAAAPSTGSSKPAAAAGQAATVKTVRVAGYGEALASATGQPVYLLTADPTGSSKCAGTCATPLKPLTVAAAPTAGAGAKSSLLSTFKRSDGQTQVLYNGHALYTRSGPSPGSYAGTASDGGVWYLISPTGAPIKSTTGDGY
jgi:predicted lipoprotein with Yx(FWY)xxD motif